MTEAQWTNLLMINGILLILFLLIKVHYHELRKVFRMAGMGGKKLKDVHKEILRKEFPFYNKLSDELKFAFEERAAEFYHQKKYMASGKVKLTDKKKLLLSAYAAEVSLGWEDYSFPSIKSILFQPGSHQSQEADWNLSPQGVLTINWKKLYRDLILQSTHPLGLKMMSRIMEKESENVFESQWRTKESAELLKSASSRIYERDAIFSASMVHQKDEFMSECLFYYFSKPHHLKNTYPEIFRQLDRQLNEDLNW